MRGQIGETGWEFFLWDWGRKTNEARIKAERSENKTQQVHRWEGVETGPRTKRSIVYEGKPDVFS